MPDDPAAGQAPNPFRARLSRAADRFRGEPLGLTAWLLVAVAFVGMCASSPPSAGPDEPVQLATAWYLTEHWLPPTGPVTFSVPASLVVDPCFATKVEVTAACEPARSEASGMVTTSVVLNYPPPYYWVVGVGERLASLFGIQYADIGGRLASVILNLGGLLLLTLFMRRRNLWWGTCLLVVSTPMAVFLGAVVNPSGWEITCGLAMAAFLSEAILVGRTSGTAGGRRAVAVALAVASIGLCLARPLGFVWATGLTISCLALARSLDWRLWLRVACSVAPGVLMGMLWTLTHQAGAGVPATTSILASLDYFPFRLQQMFGELGWLDTPMPSLLLLANLVAWGVLLRRMPSIGKAAMLCGIFGIVILPSIIETMVSGGWALWWQGRYTMPFALGFILLLLLRSGRLVPRTISVVSAISLLSLGLMVWVNAVRYAFGLTYNELPLSLANPALSPLRLGIAGIAGGLLVVVSGYLVVRMWRPEDRLPAGPEPALASTALPVTTPDPSAR